MDRLVPKREKKPCPSVECVLPARDRKDQAGETGRGGISWGLGSKWLLREGSIAEAAC